MTDIDCVGDVEVAVDREARTVTVELTPGGSVDCAFANTPNDGGGPPDDGPPGGEAPGGTPPGGTLPDTGAPAGSLPTALLGLLLVAAGVVAVRRSRG